MNKPHIIDYDDLDNHSFEQIIASSSCADGKRKRLYARTTCLVDDTSTTLYKVYFDGNIILRSLNLKTAIDEYNKLG